MTNPTNLNNYSIFTTDLLIGDVTPNSLGTPAVPGATPTPTMVADGTPFGVPVSAALEIQSVLGALLLPRLTQTQISSLIPTFGMLVYNISTDTFQAYTVAGQWITIGQGEGPSVIGAATVTWTQGASFMTIAFPAVTSLSSISVTSTGGPSNPAGSVWISNIVPGTGFTINTTSPTMLSATYIVVNPTS